MKVAGTNPQESTLDMAANAAETKRRHRIMTIVKAYPFGLLLVGVALNLIVFDVNSAVAGLPSTDSIRSLVIAAVLLLVNHTWIMTSTELTRVRFRLYATPEEWAESGTRRQDASDEGIRELERRHNIHRNTTENTVYFILLAAIFVLVSPTTGAAQIWIVIFPVARLGYTYSYLTGKDGVRGLFMSFSLLSLYGMASYLAISLVT